MGGGVGEKKKEEEEEGREREGGRGGKTHREVSPVLTTYYLVRSTPP